MSSNRPNLTLDQQFFQELLSAAYTIQQHNERVNQARPLDIAEEACAETQAESLCPHCGIAKPVDALQCERCGQEEFRPGERMQRNWASMWLMSQQQGLWPERSADEIHETEARNIAPPDLKRAPRNQAPRDFAASGILASPFEKQFAAETSTHDETPATEIDNHLPSNRVNGNGNGHGNGRTNGNSSNGKPSNRNSRNGNSGNDKPSNADTVIDKPVPVSNWALHPDEEAPVEQEPNHEETTKTSFVEAADGAERFQHNHFVTEDSNVALETFDLSASEDSSLPLEEPLAESGTDSTLKRMAALRVKLRFHRADVYLGIAVFVAAVALLWPMAGSPQHATLSPWERALVTLGIADAPQPEVHLLGDPAIEVWVDTHSALYYCPGEDQYGKTPNGRFTSQRDAQTDRFEPASRSACE